MISCTEFIPVYSELFGFLHERGGPEAVERFWAELSDHFLGNLRTLAQRRGLEGCFEYWRTILAEEACDARMTLDRAAGRLTIEMRRCPSKGRLLAATHLEPYAAYCDHCDTLYRRVLEPLGFVYEIDLSAADEARCTLTVRQRHAAVEADDNDG